MKQYLPLFLLSMLVFQAMCYQYDNNLGAYRQKRPINNSPNRPPVNGNTRGYAYGSGAVEGENIVVGETIVGGERSRGLAVGKGSVKHGNFEGVLSGPANPNRNDNPYYYRYDNQNVYRKIG